MKKPSHLLAAFTLGAALILSGCSTTTDVTSATGTTSAVNVSSVSGPVTELSYSDLAIDEADLSFDVANAVDVTLADDSSEGGDGVSIDGDTVTITTAGTYRISGTLTSGSLVVDAPDGVVNLVLDGVDITAADVAAINVIEADHVVVWLADDTKNVLADTAGSTVDDTVEDSPNATLFSTADLWIAGDGALSVTAYAADAITSKDTLVMAGSDVSVTAADDGVRGKDHLVITGGTLIVDVEGDALRSDNESVADEPDAAVGVVWIDGGTLDLTAGSDAIDAARQVTILDGDLTVAAGDDGIHSDNVLRIAGGDVSITESVEGIEGAYMYLSGGDVSVVASDDGINVSGGAEELAEETAEATTDTAADPGAMEGGRPEGGGGMGGPPMEGAGPEDEATTTDPVDDLGALTVSAMEGSGFGGPAEGDNGTRFLEFSGGTYVVDTTSDGVDVNGSMSMTGGTLVVSGTENIRQGALDVDDVFTISGGTLAANGMATMAVAPGEDSTQATLALTLSSVVPAGTVITITDDDGTQVSSFTTPKASESYIYSSELLEAGAEYTISVGGEVTGTSIGWLVLDGTATDGTSLGTVVAD
ncbi:carbohydrate-binding domain-containing protein [Nocardioides salsibiostraticola]